MFKNLLAIYSDKIIEDVQNYEPKNYYYFFNEDKKIFGIEKTISKNEYQLIKSMYIEKTIYFDNASQQKIHEYLIEKGKYPFLKEKGRILIFTGISEHDEEAVLSTLKDVFQDTAILKHGDYYILFYFTFFDTEIKPIFQALSEDFASKIIVHQGPLFRNNMLGDCLYQYIHFYIKCEIVKTKDYSDISDLILEANGKGYLDILKIIKYDILKEFFQNIEYLNFVKMFFYNNLNISKSAKILYMHRNSLLYKFEQIKKETGLVLENFNHSSAINLLLYLQKR